MAGEKVMKIETNIPTYERLKECLSERYTTITVKLLSADYALKKLGFVETVPCVIEVVSTDDEISSVIEDAFDLEIAAFQIDDENSEEWKLYERYGWLYDFFQY